MVYFLQEWEGIGRSEEWKRIEKEWKGIRNIVKRNGVLISRYGKNSWEWNGWRWGGVEGNEAIWGAKIFP